MYKITKHPLFRYALAYIIFDVILVYIGVGTPFLCVLAGFILGWYTPAAGGSTLPQQLRSGLKLAIAASFVTFVIMFANWTPAIIKAMDPAFDYAQASVPQFLSNPTASYIGWMMLMIVISPILQTLTMVFTSTVRVAFLPIKD